MTTTRRMMIMRIGEMLLVPTMGVAASVAAARHLRRRW